MPSGADNAIFRSKQSVNNTDSQPVTGVYLHQETSLVTIVFTHAKSVCIIASISSIRNLEQQMLVVQQSRPR